MAKKKAVVEKHELNFIDANEPTELEKSIQIQKHIQNFAIGDNIKVTSGATEGFTGKIILVDLGRRCVRAIVPMFGKESKLTLDFDQIEIMQEAETSSFDVIEKGVTIKEIQKKKKTSTPIKVDVEFMTPEDIESLGDNIEIISSSDAKFYEELAENLEQDSGELIQSEFDKLEDLGEHVEYETEDYERLHTQIIETFSSGFNSLYDACVLLNDMKITKKFFYSGCVTFEDYAMKHLGLKKSQAYNYCKIAQAYSKDSFQLNGKMGVTKMLVLSVLDEDDRTEIIENADFEDMTVDEVRNITFKKKDVNLDKFLNSKMNIINKSFIEIREKVRDLNLDCFNTTLGQWFVIFNKFIYDHWHECSDVEIEVLSKVKESAKKGVKK